MMSPLLQLRLRPVIRRCRTLRWFRDLALVWTIAAAASGLVWLAQRHWGVLPVVWSGLIPLGAVAAAIWRTVVVLRTPPDSGEAARRVEQRHPELQGLLTTAVQQKPDATGRYHFLQQHLIEEAIGHSVRNRWPRVVPFSRVLMGFAVQTAAFLALVLICTHSVDPKARVAAARRVAAASGIEITPGDAVIERGSSLVVLARFGTPPAAGAELVLTTTTNEPSRRISLVRSLADPVFGGRVPEVSRDLVYHVEYANSRSRDYTVTVFDRPRLDHADVQLTFPGYTALPPKEIKDTHRVSAVEGTKMSWQFHLNKPVRLAVLTARNGASNRIDLPIEPGNSTVAWTNVPLQFSTTYELHLTDAEGRTNKAPALFVFEALSNRAPELKLASPRGDLRPSALEEVSFDGTVWDDFGVAAFGIALTRPGSETQFIELGHAVAGREKRSFHHVVKLEELGVKPDQLVAWFTWADDTGPDGEVRRTTGDLYFAEVRPFDEIFREGQGGEEGGDNAEAGGAGGAGGGDPGAKLAELQKQVINATWKLQRLQGNRPRNGSGGTGHSAPAQIGNPPTSMMPTKAPAAGFVGDRSEVRLDWIGSAAGVFGQVAPQSADGPAPRRIDRRAASAGSTNYPATRLASSPADGKRSSGSFEDDLQAVREGAQQALDQAQESMEQAQNPESRRLWQAAIAAMERSLDQLGKSLKSTQALAEALVEEQAAYQTLLQLRARETEVTRSRNRSSGQGQGGAANQRQMNQLDLTQAENHYETQRSAQAPQTAERRGQLQVLSRLQELARRQQDVNDRLRELQTALQEARNAEERTEIQRRLKRLQEEQQQMLSDVDEVQQRMNRAENQSQMSEQRQQMEQTREDLQKAAQATGDGRVSQALASGSRAQNRLQQMRDDLRKDSSNAFSDELRQLRSEAREVQRRETDIAQQLRSLGANRQKRLTDSNDSNDSGNLVQQLADQKKAITNLVERATQVSQQSETSEPLLSRQLYDTLRTFQQEDPGAVSRLQDSLVQSGEMNRSLNDKLQEIGTHESGRAVEATAELLRQGLGSAAGQAEREARKGIDTLKNGIERAAERILGDDSEALRLAGDEIDSLSRQLEQEIAKNGGSSNGTDPGKGSAGRQPTEPGGTTPNGRPGGSGNAPGQPGDPSPSDSAGSSSRGSQPASTSNAGQPGAESASGTEPGAESQAAQGGSGASGSGRPTPGSQRQNASTDPANRSGQRGQQGQPGQGGQQAQDGQPGQGGGGDLGGTDLGGILGGDDGGTSGRGGGGRGGPITGSDFGPWSDRLRDAEDMVDLPELRSGIAAARERARLARLEYRRDGKKPDWAVVELQVLKPLVEVRQQIRDELARRTPQDALSPIDRDAVPLRFTEQVRHYYETLGKDK